MMVWFLLQALLYIALHTIQDLLALCKGYLMDNMYLSVLLHRLCSGWLY